VLVSPFAPAPAIGEAEAAETTREPVAEEPVTEALSGPCVRTQYIVVQSVATRWLCRCCDCSSEEVLADATERDGAEKAADLQDNGTFDEDFSNTRYCEDTKHRTLDEEIFLDVTDALGEPKRPQTAYFLFVADKRASVAEELSTEKQGELATSLALLWRSLEKADKEVYEAKAAQLKEEYDAAMRQYRTNGRVIKPVNTAASPAASSRGATSSRRATSVSPPAAAPPKYCWQTRSRRSRPEILLPLEETYGGLGDEEDSLDFLVATDWRALRAVSRAHQALAEEQRCPISGDETRDCEQSSQCSSIEEVCSWGAGLRGDSEVESFMGTQQYAGKMGLHSQTV